MSSTGLTLGAIYPDDVWVDQDLERVLEDWRSFLPPQVRMVSAHTPMPEQDTTADVAVWMATSGDIERAGRRLLRYEPDLFAYYCTTASFICGVGGDEELSRRVEAATGVPCVSTSTAVVRALRSLGVHRIAVASPYMAEVHAALVRFLRDSGFDVVNDFSLLLGQGQSIVPLDTTREEARRANVPEAECVFISCTGQKTAPFLADLERELGKPVVSSNQATGWLAQQMLGLEPRLPGLGSLFGDPIRGAPLAAAGRAG